MRLLSWLLTLLDTPPIDVLSPPDPPEWDKELLRRHGVNEIITTTREDVERRKLLRFPRSEHGYAFTFKQRGQ